MLGAAVCLVQPTRLPEASRIDIYEYSRALARLGVETHVIASLDESEAPLPGLQVHALGFPPVNTPLAWWRFATRSRAIIRRLVRERGLRIVHLFNPSPATYLLGWLLRREAPRPRVAYDLRTGGLGYRPDAMLVDAMARSAPRFADQMIALTADLGIRLLGSPERFHEVPLGVNLERFQPRGRAGGDAGEFVFVYAGTLSRNRALSRMLAAFTRVLADHPRARLAIAGDGDDRQRLERLGGGALSHAVRFLGRLPYPEIPGLLARADCGLAYVPDTAWFQPQPQLKTLEYFAAGLPVVAVRTDGNRRYWQGLPPELLTADDAESFAAGMRFAIEHRGALAPAAFRGAAEAYGWDRITRERLIPLYRAMLSRTP
jgi:glycosyltransferase involved in cell wall biosynthesis